MSPDQDQTLKSKATSSMSLETVIAMGLFGWLALSVTLMGLGIW